ncbi:MAG: hypothetical protein JOZ27_08810, partial [Caulobacteraceae bacterium]|nr:hypothetical protein [Caulobacteraceae bacterium]
MSTLQPSPATGAPSGAPAPGGGAADVSIAAIDKAKVKVDVRDLDFYYGKTHALKAVSIPFQAKAVTALI